MIDKRKAPHLNRQQRRHPVRDSKVSRSFGLPWLLMGLLIRGGYILGETVRPVVPGISVARPAGKSVVGIVGKVKAAFSRWFK
jgi:hypothetical protein